MSDRKKKKMSFLAKYMEDQREYKAKQTPKKGNGQGLETEQYDISPRIANGDKTMFDGKEGIAIEYSFGAKEVFEGLKTFQKATIYKRNITYSAILFIFFVMFATSYVKDSSQIMSIFLAVICITFVGFIWYLPAKHIKATAEATEQNKMTFNMEVFDNGIRIQENALMFNNHIDKVFETVSLYLICSGKEQVFILPKKSLKEGVSTQLKEIFSQAMKEKFIKKL